MTVYRSGKPHEDSYRSEPERPRFTFEITRRLAHVEGDAEPRVVTVGHLTIADPFPSVREWQRLYARLHQCWRSESPLFGAVASEKEMRLDRLLAAHGPRPAQGEGLNEYWRVLHRAAEQAGLGDWRSWRQLRQYVTRREARARREASAAATRRRRRK